MSNSQPGLNHRYKLKYDEYVKDYKLYLQLRGFGDHHDDWFFVKRGFFECWFAPGLHRFWQTWNPGIGYFTYRLFLWLKGTSLGGKGKQNLAIILTFLISGLIHNLVAMLFLRRCSIPLPFTFFALGVFTVIFSTLERRFQFKSWPKITHLVINVSLIILSFDFGFRMDDLLHTTLIH